MANWFVKRVGLALATIYAVITLTFVLIRFLPGGPANFLASQIQRKTGRKLNPEQLDRMVNQYVSFDPSQPLWKQYVDYMANLLSGNFGTSLYYNESNAQIIGEALPWTVFVMSIAITTMFVVGILLGATMAYKEQSRFDTFFTGLGTVLNSIPYFLAAIALLYVFGYVYGIFPTRGKVAEGVEAGLTLEFITSAFYHAALPALSVIITGTGGIALAMRGNSISVLGEDYVRVAKLRGLSTRTIVSSYVMRNAILPMYTSLLIAIGFIFGGSIILERIFVYTGVGYYLFQAVQARDYSLMMAGFIMISITVVFAILFADLTYGKLDPRIGAGGEKQ